MRGYIPYDQQKNTDMLKGGDTNTDNIESKYFELCLLHTSVRRDKVIRNPLFEPRLFKLLRTYSDSKPDPEQNLSFLKVKFKPFANFYNFTHLATNPRLVIPFMPNKFISF